jgi:hypothetical protein
MITIAEYIASENLEGVQNLALQLGYPAPKTKKEGYLFLKSLHVKDPEGSKKYFAQIHPDKDILFADTYRNMIAEPLYKNASGCNSCGMVNATGGCGCGGSFKNANNEVLNKFETYAEKGINETKEVLSDTVDKVRDMIERKDDRILKYGVVFIAGLLIGKLILK